MTKYIVHLYREMRLTFVDIEAESSEAAAAVARDKPTDDADNIEDCEGETLTALVDVVGDEEFEQSRFIDFEQEKQRRAAPALLAALESLADQADEDCPSDCRSRHFVDALDEARTAIATATAACPPWETEESYSVLLLYPDHVNDSGTETYYALVKAADPAEAVARAQRQAASAQDGVEVEPEDFAPLLVTQGHHVSEPLFNK